ncbi:serine hydrolase domain-containing protein [Thalassotalea sp. ND16A]|uniref:serine hydrolase domain-containing protein n=1 Tax=Thalassotalea sp. ND16A TaxID=1535422 RepID=UPI00051A73F7|nr:serine hydrolase domain-containing protein [Thalassotalea sp. ND16A]KGJ98094.1 hypothetical protein ND16A_0899 [Thalassotalea sp. ND16A]
MTYLRTAIILSLIVQLLCLPITKANAASAKPTTLEELDAQISTITEQANIPSVAYALLDKTGIEWLQVNGLANIETQGKASPQTLYRIGSVSKMLTSIAIMKLVEQGRLHLDDEVASLVPNVKFYNRWQETHPVRVVHLLEHTTGWDDLALKEFARKNNPNESLHDSLSFYPQSRTSRWPAGTRSAYSNSGAAVAASIVEKITGKTFEDFVDEAIFTELNMIDATYQHTEQVKSNGATSYKGNRAQAYKHLIYRPAGAVNASISDMAKLTQMFLQRGAPILANESIARMERSESTNAGSVQAAYGLNNDPVKYGPWLYYGHDGSVNGALAELRYLPQAGVGFVILMNSDNQQAMKKIREQIVTYQTQQLSVAKIEAEIQSSQALAELSGYYYTINPGFEVAHFLNRLIAVYKVDAPADKLTVRGLLFQTLPQYFLPVTEGRFKSSEHGLVELTLATDPLAGQVLHYGNKVLKPTSAFAVFGQLSVAILWVVVIFTSVLVLLIWNIRRLFGKKFPKESKSMVLWPCLASLSALILLLSLVLGMQNPYANMGNITPFSLALMLSSIAFALCSVIAGFKIIKLNRKVVGKFSYGYFATCSLVHALVTVYLLVFGVIGLQIWA